MTVTAKTSQAARRSSLLAPLELIFGVYAILLFLFLGLCALLVLLVVPGVQRRRRIARAAARAFLRLAAMPVTVTCDERLPATQCVIVSNHASYLDGIVFTAVLPARFGFVIKREMNGVPLAGLLLRKLGSEFVERFNRSRSAADARRVLRNVSNGNSLVFFPEGTFTKTPGLLKFHTGAFAMAVRAGCPVVPAVIRWSSGTLRWTNGATPSPRRSGSRAPTRSGRCPAWRRRAGSRG